MNKGIFFIVTGCISILSFNKANATEILGWDYADHTYCNADGPDTLTGSSPSSKEFFFIDPFGGMHHYDTSRFIEKVSNGIAIIYPDSIFQYYGTGTYVIQYGTWGIHGYQDSLTIREDTATAVIYSLPTTEVCVDGASFSLFNADSSNVNYKTGIWAINGTPMSGVVNPALWGVGEPHTVSYTITNGGCSSTDFTNLFIRPLPTVTFNPLPDVCEGDPAFALTGGNPGGGTYSGTGVAGGMFDPVVSGTGTFIITYTYTDGNGCTNSNTSNQTVNALPATSFAGLSAKYCWEDSTVNLTGTPTDANGVFSGSGIVDNGDGTGVFNPLNAGLGSHDIIYTYTDLSGCINADTQTVQVGTQVWLTGLAAQYCEDVTSVDFDGNPHFATAFFTPLAGLTDLGNGDGNFDPSTAGPGTYNITYNYTDPGGCMNQATQSVTVNAIPNPSITGLDTAYCENGVPDIVTGSYAPGGTFSGSIVDNANGTGTFDPSTFIVGGPYNITYTYTEPVTGCSNSVTEQTKVVAAPTAKISGNSTICKNDSANVRIVFTGNSPYDFTYTTGAISYNVAAYATDTFLQKHAPIDTTTYTISLVTDFYGCTTTGTGSAIIRVQPQAEITSEPVDNYACLGDNINFNVTATGVNVVFQWQKNGVNIPGEINSALGINNVDATDEATYRCIINSDCGPQIVSDTARLILWDNTAISSHPSDALICDGEDINFFVTATGSNLTYQWKKDNQVISDTGSFNFTDQSLLFIDNATLDYVGDYTCTVTGECGTVTSNQAALSIDSALAITTDLADKEGCPGDNITFTVVASGSSPSYRWEYNGATIPGETSPSLALLNIAAGDAGDYQCWVKSPCGDSVPSFLATLTVNTPTAIGTHPSGAQECQENNISFSVVATGSNLTYSWMLDGQPISDTGNYAGSGTDILSINNLLTNYAGSYTCLVTGSCGPVISNPAVLAVDTVINLIQDISNQDECPGDNVNFAVIANGTNLSYRWEQNGVTIAGETNPTLTLNAINAGDAGNYQCWISSPCGDSITSSVAVLTVNSITQITGNPTDATECEGETVIFNVAATGSNLQYQWIKNDTINLSNGGGITGTKTNALSITNIAIAHEGEYKCQVTGLCGTLVSNIADLVVDTGITITQQPVAQNACAGQTENYTASATGTNLSYRWQMNSVDMPGETNSILTIVNVDAADEGDYRCIIKNTCGDSVITNEVAFTLNDPVVATNAPINDTICISENAGFSIVTTGDVISYQWMLNGLNLLDTGSVFGSATQNLALSNVTSSAYAGVYTCVVTGECNILNRSATLKINDNVSISTQPVNQTLCTGENTVLLVVGSPGASVTGHQWRYNGIDIAGETGNTLVIDSAYTGMAGNYSCIVFADCANDTSFDAAITVLSKLQINTHPQAKTRCEGGSVSFNINATGNNVSYQWLQNGLPLQDTGSVSNSSTSVLTIDPVTRFDDKIYSCKVWDDCADTLYTAGAILTVNERVIITKQPTNKTICDGQPVSFNIVANGTANTYQWYKDGLAIGGATLATYSIVAVNAADAGIYWCVVENYCDSLSSNPVTLTVNVNPAITTQPVDTSGCEGNSLTVNIAATGTALTYQWFLDGAPITYDSRVSIDASGNLTIDTLKSTDAGTYHCVVTGSCGSIPSNFITVDVNQGISITLDPVDRSICSGENTTFSILATGTNLQYQWQKDNVDIPGATLQTLGFAPAYTNDGGSYRCLVIGACNVTPQSSLSAALLVDSAVVISSSLTNITACDGEDISFQVSSTGSNRVFQWERNDTALSDGGNISGANDSILSVLSVTSANGGVYSINISNACGYEEDAAILKINPSPAITKNPTNKTICVGQNTSFTITADGTDLSYQWYKDDVIMPGDTNDILIIDTVLNTDEAEYKCYVIYECNGVTDSLESGTGFLTVTDSVAIVTQPQALQTACKGNTISFNVVATGDNITYQWYKAPNTPLTDIVGKIDGAQTDGLTIFSLTDTDAGSYYCEVSGCRSKTTTLAQLQLYDSTSVTIHPIDYTAIDGGDAIFSILADGSNLSYQWYLDNVPLANGGVVTGADSNILSLNGIDNSYEGDYHCVVSGTCNDDPSNPATLTIIDSSIIVSQPQNINRCVGLSASFTISVSGTGNTFQWYKDTTALVNTANITGVDQPTLVIASVSLSDKGAYSCLVNDSVERTRPAILNVFSNTSITDHPDDVTTCNGNNATFIVTATGDSLSYQWYKDNTLIAGATSYAYTITGVLQSDAGVYFCAVDGYCGTDSLPSLEATLVVNNNPAITLHPVSDTVCMQDNKLLQVTATGTNLNYVWYKNEQAISDTGKFSGTSTSDLQIVNISDDYAGVYKCEVYNTCNVGSPNVSDLAIIRVRDVAKISQQPQDKTKCEGDNANFVVQIATIDDTVSYQWFKDNVALVDDGTHIIGATTNHLQIINVVLGDEANYDCEIVSSCDTVTSVAAQLTINRNTYISTHPVSDTLCELNEGNFFISAIGDNLIYQWYKGTNMVVDDARITGATTNNLTISDLVTGDDGYYTCQVSGICGSLNSNDARLVVRQGTNITSQPTSLTSCEGENAIFTFNVTGYNLTYQWKHNGTNLVDDGTHIIGSTTGNLQIVNVVASDSGAYVCQLSTGCDTIDINSNIAQLKVNINTTFTLQPVSDTVCEGQLASFTIDNNHTSLTYQWYHDGTALTDNANIMGSNTTTLTIVSPATSDAGLYWCEVQGPCDIFPRPSATGRLTVNTTAQVYSQPIGGTKCVGDIAGFHVQAYGENLTYQWYKDGNPLANGGTISGADSSFLQISSVVLADAGDYYCVVTGVCSFDQSSTATLVVANPVLITTQPTSDTICEGTSQLVEITATGDGLSYQWKYNGLTLEDTANYTGTSTNQLYINGADPDNSGIFTCTVSGICGPSQFSNAATVLVQQNTVVTVEPTSLTKCTGEMAVFNLTVEGDSLTYQWTKGGVPLVDDTTHIFGSASQLLSIYDVTTADAGAYTCVITGSCGTQNPSANLTVNSYPETPGTIFGYDTVCQGTQNLVYNVASINYATSYLWTATPGIDIVSGQGTNQIVVNIASNILGGTIEVQGVNNCGYGPLSPIKTLVINPVPAAYAGENVGICGSTYTLNANPPTSGTSGIWTIVNGYADFVDDTLYDTDISNLNQGDNYFLWTVTQNNCSSYDTVRVSNNQQPMDAGESEIICNHVYYFQATAPAYGTGEWSIVRGNGINIDQDNPNSIVTGLLKGVNTFRWTATYNGCPSSDTVQITNGLPTDAEAGIDQVITSDNTFLNANEPVIGTGEWTLLNGGATFADRYLYNTEVTDLMVGKNKFKWTITNSTTGCETSDTVNVTNNTADTTEAGPNKLICESYTRLEANNPHPGIGEWSIIRGAATFADNSDPTTMAFDLAPGENVLLWTVNLNGYTYDSVKITNNKPTLPVAGSNQEICVDSLQLYGNQPIIGTGTWTVTAGAGTFEDANLYNTMVTGLQNGVNRFKWTITNGGCILDDEVTISNNTPTQADAGQNISTCKDTILLQPNAPGIGTGEWSVLVGAAKFDGNWAQGMATGDNYFLWTISNEDCTSEDTVIITCNKPTTADAGVNQSICYDSILMTASTPIVGTGKWTVSSGGGDFANDTLPNTRVRNLNQGTNIFKWQIDYNGCTSEDYVTISYDFVEADAGDDRALCEDYYILEGNNPGVSDGVWSIIGGASAGTIEDPTEPNTQVTNLDRGANVFRWTITKNNCSSWDEVTITNNMPSVPFAGEDKYLCQDNTTLNANPVTVGTGVWSILSGGGVISDSTNNQASVTGLSLGANTFRWTITNINCEESDEVTIHNNLPVNVDAGESNEFCSDTTQLYANQPTIGIGRWSVLEGAATFGDPEVYNTMARSLGHGDNVLLWTVSTSTCSVADTVTITNNLPTTAVAGADQSICQNSSYLNANTVVYGQGRWEVVSGGGIISEDTANYTQVTGLNLGTNIYRWVITNENCRSIDEISIINNSPTPANAGNNFAVCQDSAELLANSVEVGTGYWSLVSGNGIILDTFNFITKIQDLGFGDNTFRWNTLNGNCKTYDEVIVTNNFAPYVYAGEDDVVYTSSTTLSGNNPSRGTGTWSVAAGNGDFQDTSDFNTLVSNLGEGMNTFVWTITNGDCDATDEVVITYKSMPVVDFGVDRAEGCPELTVQFVNSTQNGSTYFWDFGDGTSTDAVNPDEHVYSQPGRYRVILTAYGPDNLSVTKDTIITVYQSPVADFDFTPDSVYANDQHLRCYNNSLNSDTYKWEFGDGDSSSVISPTHVFNIPGEYRVILWAYSNETCWDSTSSLVKVLENGYVLAPTAFTPDGDHINDYFTIELDGVEEFQMEIYSRWGVLLYETNEMNPGWDGKFRDEYLGKGVYVWKITGKFESGRPFQKAGTLLLQR